VAVLVASDRDPDLGRVARAVPTPTLAEISPERATELTEFLAEALPPVALPDGTRVIMDRALADQEVLYFAGGEATSMLKIRAADLARAAAAKVARVTT
jgi:prolyl-tRNA editing enzyme YbaK/EbsC (Cys-tRNA(Pro) deacylase)